MIELLEPGIVGFNALLERVEQTYRQVWLRDEPPQGISE